MSTTEKIKKEVTGQEVISRLGNYLVNSKNAIIEESKEMTNPLLYLENKTRVEVIDSVIQICLQLQDEITKSKED